MLWLAEMIQHQDPAALVWGMADATRRGSGEFPGTDTRLSTAPSVWLQLYQAERKHLVDVSRTVVGLG